MGLWCRTSQQALLESCTIKPPNLLDLNPAVAVTSQWRIWTGNLSRLGLKAASMWWPFCNQGMLDPHWSWPSKLADRDFCNLEWVWLIFVARCKDGSGPFYHFLSQPSRLAVSWNPNKVKCLNRCRVFYSVGGKCGRKKKQRWDYSTSNKYAIVVNLCNFVKGNESSLKITGVCRAAPSTLYLLKIRSMILKQVIHKKGSNKIIKT